MLATLRTEVWAAPGTAYNARMMNSSQESTCQPAERNRLGVEWVLSFASKMVPAVVLRGK